MDPRRGHGLTSPIATPWSRLGFCPVCAQQIGHPCRTKHGATRRKHDERHKEYPVILKIQATKLDTDPILRQFLGIEPADDVDRPHRSVEVKALDAALAAAFNAGAVQALEGQGQPSDVATCCRAFTDALQLPSTTRIDALVAALLAYRDRVAVEFSEKTPRRTTRR